MYMHVYIHTCMYIYAFTHVDMYTCTHQHINPIYLHAHIHYTCPGEAGLAGGLLVRCRTCCPDLLLLCRSRSSGSLL